jgi:multicomponent Na+:H+ antiporter subunit E
MRQHPVPLGRLVALGTWFVVLWLMLWADVSVANVISGAVLAIAVTVMTRRIAYVTDDDTVRVAPFALLHFAGHVLWQLVKSNLSLAWEILTPTNTIAVGTVDVPLRSASPIVTMALSNVVTLTPGTVALDVRSEPPTLTVGVLHLHHPDEVRASVQRTEALAIKAFGTTTARDLLAEGEPS